MRTSKLGLKSPTPSPSSISTANLWVAVVEVHISFVSNVELSMENGFAIPQILNPIRIETPKAMTIQLPRVNVAA